VAGSLSKMPGAGLPGAPTSSSAPLRRAERARVMLPATRPAGSATASHGGRDTGTGRHWHRANERAGEPEPEARAGHASWHEEPPFSDRTVLSCYCPVTLQHCPSRAKATAYDERAVMMVLLFLLRLEELAR
jgi:hypothetical protein